MELKKVLAACPLCGSQKSLVFKKKSYILKKCQRCLLVYMDSYDVHYKEIYKENKRSSVSRYYQLAQKTDIIVFNERLKILEKHAVKNSILDVGCNIGTFLNVCRQRGWKEILGVEPNPVAANECVKPGIPVINEFFGDNIAVNFEKKFDAVNISDVIEHTVEPVTILADIHKVLKPGGLIMIVTPDFDNFMARYLQVKPSEHLLYFNKDSLSYLLNRAGFKLKYIRSCGRQRPLNAMQYSTTFNSGIIKKLIKLSTFIKADVIINYFLKKFIKDEILAIAIKE